MKLVRAAKPSQFPTPQSHYRPRSQQYNRLQDHRCSNWTNNPARTRGTKRRRYAMSQLKKQKITTEPPTRTPQCNLNFEEVTTETSVPPASTNTARSTQTSLQARNQQGTETKRRPVRVPSTSTQVVQVLSTDDEDNNHKTTPPSPTPERPRSPTPAPTNMALVTYVPNPTHQPEPEMDRLKRMATEDKDPADSLRRHVAQVQQYQAATRLLQDAPVAHHRAL